MPQKADSGSDVDSDSGSEDQKRGGGVKRKPAAAKVFILPNLFASKMMCNSLKTAQHLCSEVD